MTGSYTHFVSVSQAHRVTSGLLTCSQDVGKVSRMPTPPTPAESERIWQSKLRLRAAQIALGLRNADMAHALDIAENTYSNWIGSDPKRTIPERAALRLWTLHRIPMEFIYGGDISRTDYDLAQKLREACAELGAVVGAPVAEFPMQADHLNRPPAKAPPRRRPPGATLHEPQDPLRPRGGGR